MKNRISLPEGPLPTSMTSAQFRELRDTGRLSSITASGDTTRVASTIRLPKRRKKSQAEMDYERRLAVEFPSPAYDLKSQAIRFVLPSGTVYTPDVTVWAGDRLMLVVEIKGERSAKFKFDGTSKEKFKAAIAAFPNLKFRYAGKSADDWIVSNSYEEGGA